MIKRSLDFLFLGFGSPNFNMFHVNIIESPVIQQLIMLGQLVQKVLF